MLPCHTHPCGTMTTSGEKRTQTQLGWTRRAGGPHGNAPEGLQSVVSYHHCIRVAWCSPCDMDCTMSEVFLAQPCTRNPAPDTRVAPCCMLTSCGPDSGPGSQTRVRSHAHTCTHVRTHARTHAHSNPPPSPCVRMAASVAPLSSHLVAVISHTHHAARDAQLQAAQPARCTPDPIPPWTPRTRSVSSREQPHGRADRSGL